MGRETSTVRVTNIPLTAIAPELSDFFEGTIGKGSVFACEIYTERKNWKSRGTGRVQFETVEAANRATLLSVEGKLEFQRAHLVISPSFEEIIGRPIDARNRVNAGDLHVGFFTGEGCITVLESWALLKAEIMPERKRVEFWVVEGENCFKMEVQFGDVDDAFGCFLDGKSNAFLLKLKYAPRIYQKISGPTVASKFSNDRYHVCKEDFEFLWVRTTDFSKSKSIGHSSYFCWELNGLLASEIRSCFPHYEELGDLQKKKEGGLFCSETELVPVINSPSDSKLAYEILYQLNSLVHTQKLSVTAANTELFDILSGLTVDTANMILSKLHMMKSTCYDPAHFIQNQLNTLKSNQRHPLSLSKSMPTDKNLMACHRVLITPSKVYFLGPELETSNYIVKHYSAYASDFLRVSFVDEDWSKLHSDAISTRIEHGICSEPYRTGIYNRILSFLRYGITIGTKKFEFLVFSASQLRANSVWMFASNSAVSAENIREWMGHFSKIRSVSKCAARMGQLFSSSRQTCSVPTQDVQVIPDIEVTIDGIKYCFSDGVGKISLNFARQVAQKCGLNQTPSAFQIRYGGYKGVVAVDRTSFRKLSLRRSMLKFDSRNTMLNITKWSEYLPCYLNREIICLLSTLGIEDEKFESMQHEQMRLLDEMLTNGEVALNVLEGMAGGDTKSILVKMLLKGYEPDVEPYLSMMLKAHREYQLSDIRSKCRIFVEKGRVLLGCMDETCTLNYGEVYIRVTMTKAELQDSGQDYFRKVDEATSVVVVGKIVVTKNPCLHPGDIRVLQAIYDPALEATDLVDCIVFPQKGERPHPNECSGGDLDGDQYFVCWDTNLIPSSNCAAMDYIGRRPRLMDHDVTLEEIYKFFIDYMINDTLGTISTAHLVHADREPSKAQSPKCLQLSTLHSMAVDFAKTGAPAEMPRVLKPKEYPDFLERGDRPTYASPGIIGKLYRATIGRIADENSEFVWSESVAQAAYDYDLEVNGFEAFIDAAKGFKNQYTEKLSSLMNYYGAKSEDEILTGNLRIRSTYLQRDKRRYSEMKDRILVAVRSLHKEAEGWFKNSCRANEQSKMASAWYHVTYHADYCSEINFLSFPWTVGDILLNMKSSKLMRK
ncbi:RNA-dependent RNA polymerase 2 [Tasmannia lanceolata]|uniref:RNA-dependent RNA polymerase 2 n=1 Tax=Tasmannia lanceolata TaxID=3420 RepID=UPI004063D444